MIDIKKILFTLFLLPAFPNSPLALDLTIGVEDIEYYPLYAKRDNQYTGFAREFFDAFAKAYQHNVTYKPMPIKRLYISFFNGDVDLKFPDHPFWAQDKKADREITYSKGVIEYIDGVMIPGEQQPGTITLKRLGIVRGFTAWDYLNEIEAGRIQIQENGTLKGLLNLIKAERIDGIYFNVFVSRYYLKHTLFDENALLFDQTLPHSRNHYHASSIKYPTVISEINAFMIDHAELIQALKNKYEVNL